MLTVCNVSQAAAYRWAGEWDPRAETILRQHAVQSGLTPAQQALAKWSEFIAVHVDHPLSFIVFAELVAQLKGPLAAGQLSADEVRFVPQYYFKDLKKWTSFVYRGNMHHEEVAIDRISVFQLHC